MYFELYNVIYLHWFNIILLRSGNIHPNHGPVANQFNFCHWNLNGLMAHDKLKITLIEAYNAVYHYDVIAISETFLNSNINDSDICIQGFSHDVFRKDHPNDTSRGGVCLCSDPSFESDPSNEYSLLRLTHVMNSIFLDPSSEYWNSQTNSWFLLSRFKTRLQNTL